MQRRKTKPRLPLRGYYQFKLMLATYAALLRTLFVNHFPLYTNFLLLFRILYHENMGVQEHQFTKAKCAQLTW